MTVTSLYQPNQEEMDLTELVNEFAPLVKRIADQSYKKNSSGLDLDDLIQSGVIGLLQAKQTYQDNRGASFKTYAAMKIKFAIFDGLRKHSGITRDVSQHIKKIARAIVQVEQNDLEVSGSHIADALGLTESQYVLMVEEINAYKTVSTEEVTGESAFRTKPVENPMYQALKGELRSGVKEIITSLPEREQMILALYYNEFLSLKEIGDLIGLTEARVSQLHSQLLTKLKSKMAHFQEILSDELW